MAIKTYQLYGTAAASASAVAAVTVRRDCEVVGIGWGFEFDQVADNSRGIVALSVNPSTQIATNDGMGTMLEVRQSTNLVTSGIGATGQNGFALIPPVALRTNDILYMHMSIVTTTITGSFIIYVREK